MPSAGPAGFARPSSAALRESLAAATAWARVGRRAGEVDVGVACGVAAALEVPSPGVANEVGPGVEDVDGAVVATVVGVGDVESEGKGSGVPPGCFFFFASAKCWNAVLATSPPVATAPPTFNAR